MSNMFGLSQPFGGLTNEEASLVADLVLKLTTEEALPSVGYGGAYSSSYTPLVPTTDVGVQVGVRPSSDTAGGHSSRTSDDNARLEGVNGLNLPHGPGAYVNGPQRNPNQAFATANLDALLAAEQAIEQELLGMEASLYSGRGASGSALLNNHNYYQNVNPVGGSTLPKSTAALPGNPGAGPCYNGATADGVLPQAQHVHDTRSLSGQLLSPSSSSASVFTDVLNGGQPIQLQRLTGPSGSAPPAAQQRSLTLQEMREKLRRMQPSTAVGSGGMGATGELVVRASDTQYSSMRQSLEGPVGVQGTPTRHIPGGSAAGMQPSAAVDLQLSNSPENRQQAPDRAGPYTPTESAALMTDGRTNMASGSCAGASTGSGMPQQGALQPVTGAGPSTAGSIPLHGSTPARPAVQNNATSTRSSASKQPAGGSTKKPQQQQEQDDRAFTLRAGAGVYQDSSPGQQGSGTAATTPSKSPKVLPEVERTARLEQLYNRTHEWRRRCEDRYRKEREAREAMFLAENCTFSPQVNKASLMIAQGTPVSIVYEEVQRSAKKPVALPNVNQKQQQQQQWARGTSAGSAGVGGGGVGSDGGGANPATPLRSSSPAVDALESGARMYARAQVRRAKLEALKKQLADAEEAKRKFVARSGVAPRLYEPRDPAKAAKHLPSGMEECTFHPRTRWHTHARDASQDDDSLVQRFDNTDILNSDAVSAAGSATPLRPKSAPHARPSRCSATNSAGGESSADGNGADASPQRPGELSSNPSVTTLAQQGQGSVSALRHSNLVAAGLASSKSGSSFPGFNGGGPQSGSVGHASRASYASGLGQSVAITRDLDWEEFIMRQQRFLESKSNKLAALAHTEPTAPAMSPGTKKLLRDRTLRQSTAMPLSEHSLLTVTGDQAQQQQQRHQQQPYGEAGQEGSQLGLEGEASLWASPSTIARWARAEAEMYRECTHQPQITRRAATRPGSTLDQLVDGGRSRREEWLEQQRAVKEVQELEGVTFRPVSYTRGAYAEVQPRVTMRNIEQYMAAEARKRRLMEAKRAQMAREREALELQACTFKPQTTPLPAYLLRQLEAQYAAEQELYAAEMAEMAGEEYYGGEYGGEDEAQHHRYDYGDDPEQQYAYHDGPGDVYYEEAPEHVGMDMYLPQQS